MSRTPAALILFIALCLPAFPAAGIAQSPTPDTTATPAYVGADACKSCHGSIYASWSQTKHARAISRLSREQRAGGQCIACHVTGSPEVIAREGADPSHPNVQCESCHGPGGLHAADPAVRTGLTKMPAASRCEGCHNEKSPHYRGFVYAAMVGLSHPVR